MKTICDLPVDLVEDEIISRVPMTSLRSVRSTCKKWNTSCKNRIIFGKAAKKMMVSRRISLMNIDLSKDNGDLSIRQARGVESYLGQTRWIEPRNSFQSSESSSSWKVLDDVTPDWEIWDHHIHNVSLKGNAYFPAHKIITEEGSSVAGFFVCFDYTTERFGPLLPLPCQYYRGRVSVSYSCVREEQLTVLYQHWDARETIEISVTDKIGLDVVSWTKFLKVVSSICVHPSSSSFFIDVGKKIVVVFLVEMVHAYLYQTDHVFGQDGYFKSVRIRQAPDLEDIFYGPTLVCSSYLPSLLQPIRLIERM
ncbi:hypothetical protein HID58_063015 [Brassica napus]|uniref:F-box domain-containing protein n=1 Tax=Brassica napus TaxID=3708 RepID=A0ABQ8A329_BRANA|nr:hypothetical protein HID58_063015 [Brassica napus]